MVCVCFGQWFFSQLFCHALCLWRVEFILLSAQVEVLWEFMLNQWWDCWFLLWQYLLIGALGLLVIASKEWRFFYWLLPVVSKCVRSCVQGLDTSVMWLCPPSLLWGATNSWHDGWFIFLSQSFCFLLGWMVQAFLMSEALWVKKVMWSFLIEVFLVRFYGWFYVVVWTLTALSLKCVAQSRMLIGHDSPMDIGLLCIRYLQHVR
jgi:hypothetical protein